MPGRPAHGRREDRREGRPGAGAGAFWGGLAAFTSTIAQAGGPPFQVFVLRQQLDKMTYVGTFVMFFAVVNALKVIPYFALGQFSRENFVTTLMLLPVATAAIPLRAKHVNMLGWEYGGAL